MVESGSVAFGLAFRVVQLRRVEGDPRKILVGDSLRKGPFLMLGRGEKRRKPLIERKKGRPRWVVGRSDEPAEPLFEPERRIGFASRHEHRRAVLERDADDARAGKFLFEAIAERSPVEKDGR